jgi:hypothetical protein
MLRLRENARTFLVGGSEGDIKWSLNVRKFTNCCRAGTSIACDIPTPRSKLASIFNYVGYPSAQDTNEYVKYFSNIVSACLDEDNNLRDFLHGAACKNKI